MFASLFFYKCVIDKFTARWVSAGSGQCNGEYTKGYYNQCIEY